ncbi:MAG: hypothetical protein CBC05_00535 [Crocinitomicaceae bacterium TMED45]|nr:MAG: hypothetical protein CBC05_00535 [Crocinitomicaceae bacterium TMED45]
MYDNQEGSEVANPELARFFYVQKPNIMVNLDDKNAEVKMHKGPADIGEIQKIIDLLRNTAKTNLLDFDLREFGREIKPKNYAFRLNTNTMTDNIQTESLSGLIGTVKTSSQKLENAKLLIKHRKPVDEEVPGSRSRNISALYIENADGERFKYPFIHLNGARAMTRHVQSGGTPYDEVGQSVINMSEQLSKIREVLNIMRRSPAIQEQAASVMSSLLIRQDKLRETIKRITSMEGHKNYSENFVAKVNAEATPDAINSMKEKFTITNVDNRIQELIPMINEINDEENTLDKLRGAVQTKLAQPIEMMPPKPIDIADMPINFINDRTKIAARLNLVGKLAKDDEIAVYLDRMAAKLQGSDKEPAGGEAAEKAGDMAPYRKDDIQVIMKVLDDAKVKALIKQVETQKTQDVSKMAGESEEVTTQSELSEMTQLEESLDQMLGVFSPSVIVVKEEEKAEPETDFTKWLKSNYNKTPRDLTADEYAKMSKEFQEQKKKDESMETEGNEFIDARRQAIKNGDKEFTVGGKTFKVTGDTSDEKSQNEAEASDMFKGPHGKYSQTAQNKPVMFKGKQIDLDTVEYDMQDYSDMIFEPESGMKYTDGTEVADEDISDLMNNDDFIEWVRIDYMDKEMDRADMMRDGKESELDIMKRNAGIQSEDESVEEGGNAFDIAMGDAEQIISDAMGDKEAMDNLQKLHDDEDDSYAKSTIKDYMDRLAKEGLFTMQRDIAMKDNAGPQESAEADPNIARMQELINYRS